MPTGAESSNAPVNRPNADTLPIRPARPGDCKEVVELRMHGSGIRRTSGRIDRHANQATRSERVGEVEHVDTAGRIAGHGNAIGTETDDFLVLSPR